MKLYILSSFKSASCNMYILHTFSLLSLIITIISMCAVLFWVMFRHDATPIIHIVGENSKKRKKVTYKNDGTQNAYFVAIIASIIPWTAIFGYFAKMCSENSYLYSEHITDIPASGLIVTIIMLAIIAMVVSFVFYNFIRRCGAESHCKRDLQYINKQE